MKKHLILMTAMLSFCITNNCESSVKAKNNGEACEKAFHCKSNVCTGNKCEPGKKNAGEKVLYLEECASQQVSCKPDEEYWKDELKKEKDGGPNVCETIIKNREDNVGKGNVGGATEPFYDERLYAYRTSPLQCSEDIWPE